MYLLRLANASYTNVFVITWLYTLHRVANSRSDHGSSTMLAKKSRGDVVSSRWLPCARCMSVRARIEIVRSGQRQMSPDRDISKTRKFLIFPGIFGGCLEAPGRLEIQFLEPSSHFQGLQMPRSRTGAVVWPPGAPGSSWRVSFQLSRSFQTASKFRVLLMDRLLCLTRDGAARLCTVGEISVALWLRTSLYRCDGAKARS